MSDTGDFEVGYRCPPRSTQFRKGQSGNPSGRPRRKPPSSPPSFPELDATHNYIRNEARRRVTVREGGEAKTVAVVEAVLHAMSITAMKGSILAQRTLLEYQLDEDERIRAERKESYDYWWSYVQEARRLFAAAEARGEPAPEIYPHPADVLLDHATLGCRIVGPMNECEARSLDYARDLAALMLELMVYVGEPAFDPADPHNHEIGPFTFVFINLLQLLPRRMQTQTTTVFERIEAHMMGPRRRWQAALEARCLALDFRINLAKLQPTNLDLRRLNLRYEDGAFVPHRWRRKRGAADGQHTSAISSAHLATATD